MWIYPSFFQLNFSLFVGGGMGGIIHSPDSITIIIVSILHRSWVPASVRKARVVLVTSQPLQQAKKTPTTIRQQTTLAATTTTTPKGDCETSLSESDLWQQIDLHFFTSYIASAIINEHDKLVQVFPNLINVCRKFRPNRTLINRWLISLVLWTIVHGALHRSLNLRFFLSHTFSFFFLSSCSIRELYIFFSCVSTKIDIWSAIYIMIKLLHVYIHVRNALKMSNLYLHMYLLFQLLINPIFLHRWVESRQLMDDCTHLSFSRIKTKI